MVASKTPIGVVFDTTNTLAIAKDEFANIPWGFPEDVNGAINYSSATQSTGDWQGFNNTKAMYETDKTGENFQIILKVLQYSTTGTEQGQWYVPAMGELKAVSDNKDTINVALTKIGGTELSGNYWSSSEQNKTNSYQIAMEGNVSSSSKYSRYKLRPVINFSNKNVVGKNLNFGFGGVTTCTVGDILYSDKKCYINGLLGGKTPIGVVFDASRRTAIALEDSSPTMYWANNLIDPGLPKMEKTQALQDFSGKANTAKIKTYNSGYMYDYPAANYAYNYTTTGTNVGDWYLPALGELNTVYTNKVFLNYALSLVGKNAIQENSHWSSSIASYNQAWNLSFADGSADTMYFDWNRRVLPVLAF